VKTGILASPVRLVAKWRRFITETYPPDASAPTQKERNKRETHRQYPLQDREATERPSNQEKKQPRERNNKQPRERKTSNRENEKQATERTKKQATERTEKQATERTKQPKETKYILKEKAAATDKDYIKKEQCITLRFPS
jgi:hypothetical protein